MDYLSTVYSRKEKPKTSYPEKLAKKIFKDHIKYKKGLFLEVGCGNYDLLNEFSKIGLNVVGTDLLSTAGKDYKEIEVYKNDIERENLPFSDESIDYVFSKSVVEHLYNPQIYFNEVFRVLKNNGKLITLTPDWEVQKNKFYDDWTHKTPFSIITMNRLYKLAGFKEYKIEYFKQLPILFYNKLLLTLSNVFAPFIKEREESKLRWIMERQILGVGIK